MSRSRINGHAGPHAGKPELLTLSELKVDEHYQRELEQIRLEKIADDWDGLRANPVKVSRRSDGDYIIDGQHTAMAAIAKFGPKYKHWCMVYEGLTPQREAEIFDRQRQNVRPLTAYDEYKSRVFRRERVATAIDAIVIRSGLRVAPCAGSNSITAVAALERAHTKHKNLEETLGLLRGWGTAKGGVFNSTLIKGVSRFLARYPDVDRGRLLQKLKVSTPGEIVAQISVKRDTDRLSMEVCGALILRAIYNHRLREGKLPRFNDQVD